MVLTSRLPNNSKALGVHTGYSALNEQVGYGCSVLIDMGI